MLESVKQSIHNESNNTNEVLKNGFTLSFRETTYKFLIKVNKSHEMFDILPDKGKDEEVTS